MQAGLDEKRELERAEVFRRRYREARAAGLDPGDALRFAESTADVGLLRLLVNSRVAAATIARIVL